MVGDFEESSFFLFQGRMPGTVGCERGGKDNGVSYPDRRYAAVEWPGVDLREDVERQLAEDLHDHRILSAGG